MMNIHRPPYPTPTLGTCATIGFFDGVHNGHSFLLKYTQNEAKKRGLEMVVITFDEHPRRVIHADYQPALLTTLDEKLSLLEQQNVDQVYILDFNEQMAQMEPESFMRQVLVEQLNVHTLVMGYDHRFGHNAAIDYEEYRQMGCKLGIEVLKAPAFEKEAMHISSTAIRKALSTHQIKTANLLLGYPFSLSGKVVQGRQLGRRINFPTANLRPATNKLIPAKGVYGGSAYVGHQRYGALINIGHNPSIAEENPLTVEAYLFDFNGSLYDQTLRLEFDFFIREEQKFETIDQLRAQIERDRDIFLTKYRH